MSAYDTVVNADSPAQYLKLGEASGTNAADTSGNARAGTYTGSPTLAQAGILPSDLPAGGETCILLTGGAYVSVANAAWQQTASCTWEAWCTVTPPLGSHCLVGQDSGSGTNRRVQLLTQANGVWVPAVFTAAGQKNSAPDAPTPVSRKLHVVLTSDGTNSTFYVNAVALATIPSGALNTASVTLALDWGANNGGAGWAGKLEKVATYPTALSAARVLAHFQAGTNPFADAFTSAGTLDDDWIPQGVSGTGFDISGFGTEGSEPGSLAKTAWAVLTPLTSGNMTIDTSGSGFTPTINVYIGSALGSLALVATGTTTLTVALAAGTVYRVQVGGAGGLLNYSFNYVSTGHVFKGHGTFAADTASAA